MDKVAVLLPVYKNDNAFFLIEAIESLCRQTLEDFIIFILVDGPIPADLKSVLYDYHDNPIIEIVYFDVNRGLPTVLNDGIRLCLSRGIDFIARMDADDICFNDRLEIQLNFLKEKSNVDVVGGFIEEFEIRTGTARMIRFPLNHEECLSTFRYRDPLAHPAVMFRISFFLKAGFYDIRLKGISNWDDTGLWYKGFKAGCIFANLPNLVLKFRINDDFYSSRRNGLKRAMSYTMFRYGINRDLDLGLRSNLFLGLKFFLNIAPVSLKRFAYANFR